MLPDHPAIGEGSVPWDERGNPVILERKASPGCQGHEARREKMGEMELAGQELKAKEAKQASQDTQGQRVQLEFEVALEVLALKETEAAGGIQEHLGHPVR